MTKTAHLRPSFSASTSQKKRRLGERNPYDAAILGSTGPAEPDRALMKIVKPTSRVLDAVTAGTVWPYRD